MKFRNARFVWYEDPGPDWTQGAGPSRGEDPFGDLLDRDRLLHAPMSREAWKLLWDRYGLDGLLELVRPDGGDGPGADGGPGGRRGDDERLAAALVGRSLAAGYDPVSGLFGRYS